MNGIHVAPAGVRVPARPFTTVSLPYTPLGVLFQLVPLPPRFLAFMGLIVLAYVATAELAKRWFCASAQH